MLRSSFCVHSHVSGKKKNISFCFSAVFMYLKYLPSCCRQQRSRLSPQGSPWPPELLFPPLSISPFHSRRQWVRPAACSAWECKVVPEQTSPQSTTAVPPMITFDPFIHLLHPFYSPYHFCLNLSRSQSCRNWITHSASLWLLESTAKKKPKQPVVALL